MKDLKMFDDYIRDVHNVQYVVGTDDVGVGSYAGPIVVVSIILDPSYNNNKIKDSKKIQEQNLRDIMSEILEHTIGIGYGIVGARLISKLGAGKAKSYAFNMSYNNIYFFEPGSSLDHKQIYVNNIKNMTYDDCDMVSKHKVIHEENYILDSFHLIDNMEVVGLDDSQLIIQGDSTSLSIAAASIAAKVMCDDIMIQLSEVYPEFSFASHKGYGTEKHREEIKLFGVTKEHRMNFKPIKTEVNKNNFYKKES